jgi:Carbamoylphosphate synthase large subunit (split gene in MJ)
MNILITSAGKRVSLVQFFQKELKKINNAGKVFTTELNPSMSPAASISDQSFAVPKVNSKNYPFILLEICINNNIRVVIPTIDTELEVLAKNKELFKTHGVDLIVSDYNFIKLCRDKRKTNLFFQEKNISIPHPINKLAPSFPLFVKPYDGSLSKDIHFIRNADELTADILNNPKLMFMEYIDKSIYKEFTVDMYYGRDNNVKSIVPRERIEIRAGEINKGFTRKNYLVQFLYEKLKYIQGVVGCICIQLFYNETSMEVIGIEINPRFGGGYPLSFHAKANYPLNIINEYLLNKTIEYTSDWLDNTLMIRYDSEIIIFDKK